MSQYEEDELGVGAEDDDGDNDSGSDSDGRQNIYVGSEAERFFGNNVSLANITKAIAKQVVGLMQKEELLKTQVKEFLCGRIFAVSSNTR